MEIQVDLKFVGKHTECPAYAKPGDAGVDLIADIPEPIVLWAGWQEIIPTGIAIQILEPNVVAYVMSRSGLCANNRISVGQGVGTIDYGYRGEIKVMLKNEHIDMPFKIEPGMRIAQLVFMPVFKARFRVVDDVDQTERGAGGFGHTGV